VRSKTKIAAAVVLVVLGIVGRLVPHAWNFTPIVAIGLLSGAYVGKKYAFAVPALAMILSDVFIGFYSFPIQLSVYISMGLAGLLGLTLKKSKNPIKIGTAALSGSTLFFLVTNAAVWGFTPLYEKSISGLVQALAAGIPFYRNAIVGDVWYSLLLFGVCELTILLHKHFAGSILKNCAPTWTRTKDPRGISSML
jgi:hypothetical protein